MPNRRRWLSIGIAAWILVLAGAGVWAARHGAATVPEQRTASQEQPAVDRVVREAVTAAGPQVAVSIGGYERLETCRITQARDGVRYERRAYLYVAPAGERALLDRVAAGLPRSYRPTVFAPPASPPILAADTAAPDFVKVEATRDGDGRIRLDARTGCVQSDKWQELETPADGPARDALDRMAAALDGPPTDLRAVAITRFRTITATSAASGPLGDRIAKALPAGAVVVVNQPDLLAWYAGNLSGAAERHDGKVTVTATEFRQ